MYPNIYPVEPGRDGWWPIYSTPSSRILFHCGLLPAVKMSALRDGLKLSSNRKLNWEIAVPIPESFVSEDVRPIKVSFVAMRNLLRKVVARFGKREALVILKEAAGAEHISQVTPEQFRKIYFACQDVLNREPKQLR